MGGKKNAMWRVVVADRRSPRDGRFIEMIGHYNPQTQPSQIVIDRERLQHWLDRGAEPSNTVRKLMRAQASGAATAGAVAEEPTPADAEDPTPTDAEGAELADAAEPPAETEAPETGAAGQAETAASGEGETESG